MGSIADHINEALPGEGSLRDRELAYWAEQAGGGGGVTIPTGAGLFHRPQFTSSGVTTFGDSIRLGAIDLPVGKIRRIAFHVGSAGDAASRMRPVIYKGDGAGGAPKTLLVDGGQVDTSAIGIKVVTVTEKDFKGGLVWAGVNPDAGTVPSVTYIVNATSRQVAVNSADLTAASNSRGMAWNFNAFPKGPAPAIFPDGGMISINPVIVGIECY